MFIGNVAIVLNAHFPYVRRAGRWPHGEESLHQVVSECYVPLLAMLHDMRAAGLQVPLTLAISPVLLEQLADPVIAKHAVLWLGEQRGRLLADLTRFEANGDGHGAYLARFYLDLLDVVERNFVGRFERNLVGALRGLLRTHHEVLLTPASAAYLPTLSPNAERVQLEIGAMTVLAHLGQRPVGLWLPGGGPPHDVVPCIRELGLRYAVGTPRQESCRAACVGGLSIIHPDAELMQHVIAPGIGYPGDGLYREFYRHHPDSGVAYWRVTGVDVPQADKAWYDPYLAFSCVEEHAAHFVRSIHERLEAASEAGMEASTVVLAFDVELFGHWWFEGVRWLQHVLQRLMNSTELRLVTLRQIDQQLPDCPASPRERHLVFEAPATAPLWRRLDHAADRFRGVVARHATARGLIAELLGQAARELLLAQSGDWLALIATDGAADYARRRFDEHLARFERLLFYAERDDVTPDAETYLHEIGELDNPFPFVNYRMFG